MPRFGNAKMLEQVVKQLAAPEVRQYAKPLDAGIEAALQSTTKKHLVSEYKMITANLGAGGGLHNPNSVIRQAYNQADHFNMNLLANFPDNLQSKLAQRIRANCRSHARTLMTEAGMGESVAELKQRDERTYRPWALDNESRENGPKYQDILWKNVVQGVVAELFGLDPKQKDFKELYKKALAEEKSIDISDEAILAKVKSLLPEADQALLKSATKTNPIVNQLGVNTTFAATNQGVEVITEVKDTMIPRMF